MRIKVPTNTTRLASAMLTKAARAGVITHPVVKPSLASGLLAKAYHPGTKG